VADIQVVELAAPLVGDVLDGAVHYVGIEHLFALEEVLSSRSTNRACTTSSCTIAGCSSFSSLSGDRFPASVKALNTDMPP